MNFIKNKFYVLFLLTSYTSLQALHAPAAKRRRTEAPALEVNRDVAESKATSAAGKETKQTAETTFKGAEPIKKMIINTYANPWPLHEAWLEVDENKDLSELTRNKPSYGMLIAPWHAGLPYLPFYELTQQGNSERFTFKLVAAINEETNNHPQSYVKLNDKTLVTGATFNHSNLMQVWDISNPQKVSTLISQSTTIPSSVVLRLNDTTILLSGQPTWAKTATLVDLSDPKNPTILSTITNNNNNIMDIIKLSEDKLLITNTQGLPLATLWDISDLKKPKTVVSFAINKNHVIRLSNSTFATYDDYGHDREKTITVWDLADLQPIATLTNSASHLRNLPGDNTFVGRGVNGQTLYFRPNVTALKEVNQLGYQDRLRLDTLIKRLHSYKISQTTPTKKEHSLNMRWLLRMPIQIQAMLKKNFNITEKEITAYQQEEFLQKLQEKIENPFAGGTLDTALTDIFNKSA